MLGFNRPGRTDRESNTLKGPWPVPRLSARRFARAEDGVMTILGITVFLIILMVAGIGVDLMRFERDRSALQATLDRAALAAADLDQQLDPTAVFHDYLRKAGLLDYLTSLKVEEGFGYRTVSATAEYSFATQFMHMSGVDELTATATTQAEERIDGVEISLVLDVSGSMNWNSKLSNLKVAARDFVDTMFDNSQDGNLSISIVPYATQVSVPDAIMSQLNVSNEQTYSNCVNFASSDFNTTAITPTMPLVRALHFDPWYTYDSRTGSSSPPVLGTGYAYSRSLPVCEALSSREIIPLSKDRNALKTYISNMVARGNTSIDVGMKWGTALVDPSMQPVVTNLIAQGVVDPAFADRPTSYSSGDTLKVIVLMTDGENTSQYYIDNNFRSGESNIWYNAQEGKYSVYVGLDDGDYDNDGNYAEPMFYWPFAGTWRDHAYGEGTYQQTTTENVCRSYKRNGSCKRYKKVKKTITVNEPGSAAVVTYPDLWAYTSLASVVRQFYEPWMGGQAWYDWYYPVRKYVDSTTKDARTKAICDAAKAKGVIVYTIGFEAPSRGRAVLRDCASSDSHYFDVQGLEIRAAFAAIASSIRKLRLTQ